MGALVKSKRKNIIFGAISVLLAIVGTVALALFSLEGVYAAVAIFAPLTAFGYYGIPVFFTRAMRESAALSVLRAYEDGITDAESISEATGLTPKAAEQCIAALRAKKMI